MTTPVGGPLIGPNVLIQTAAALRAQAGEAQTARIFAGAGLAHRLADPPGAMVPMGEALALMRSLATGLAPTAALSVAEDSGRRTGAYVAANRIPALARKLLGLLPAPLAARLLGRAIVAHAWTFAGGAPVISRWRRGAILIEIADEADPLTRAWRAAVLAQLFSLLVTPAAHAEAAGSTYTVHLA
ncbi:bacteriochlorophyll 4-vinyl reductase [Microvirga tunisiensis]|uniref:Bacteriochlorophyll 4-vinyl reductase n=1 Tax=Pannonibacter tanglangensis TaxID=2750084 RepID=A0A7X5F5R0_9HYPH|nr:bacteriochlorophyll 4-vinyl reductase [Pannonibacter sp. XCT-53]NBN79315.1 bacteriochlorophyll 4-vinyl reductase [Pannonibacter sp. XCT-53]